MRCCSESFPMVTSYLTFLVTNLHIPDEKVVTGLRLFLRIELSFPIARDFRVISARSRARAYTQHIENGGFF